MRRGEPVRGRQNVQPQRSLTAQGGTTCEMSTQNSDLEGLLGAQIRVTTTIGEEIEGELFCIDNSSNCGVILLERLENGNVNYRWTKANVISEVIVTRAPIGSDEFLPYVDLRQLEKRELEKQQALKLQELRADKDAANASTDHDSTALEDASDDVRVDGDATPAANESDAAAWRKVGSRRKQRSYQRRPTANNN